MPEPHVIRLRGPWQLIAAEGGKSRLKLPTSWEAFEQDVGCQVQEITLARHFHRPPRVDEGEPVGLAVQTPHQLLTLQLNGQPLTLADRQEVTSLVETRNELQITLRRSADKQEDSLLDVQLEFLPA